MSHRPIHRQTAASPALWSRVLIGLSLGLSLASGTAFAQTQAPSISGHDARLKIPACAYGEMMYWKPAQGGWICDGTELSYLKTTYTTKVTTLVNAAKALTVPAVPNCDASVPDLCTAPPVTEYCKAHPTDPECLPVEPETQNCVTNPTLPGCLVTPVDPTYCALHPSDPACQTNPNDVISCSGAYFFPGPGNLPISMRDKQFFFVGGSVEGGMSDGSVVVYGEIVQCNSGSMSVVMAHTKDSTFDTAGGPTPTTLTMKPDGTVWIAPWPVPNPASRCSGMASQVIGTSDGTDIYGGVPYNIAHGETIVDGKLSMCYNGSLVPMGPVINPL